MDTFHAFWDSALAYQQANKLPLWPPFSEEQIAGEIQDGLHFSAYLPDGPLIGYFSIALSDQFIWGAQERGDAIYIHRMCVNPARKGGNLASSVFNWANDYASSLGRKFIRMDTWADNERLVEYYVACGFRHIGCRQLGDAPELPPHYSYTNLALFENAVDQLRAGSE